MVSKSGFIRDPSGLLMSVIRTLEDHQDERHRDTGRVLIYYLNSRCLAELFAYCYNKVN